MMPRIRTLHVVLVCLTVLLARLPGQLAELQKAEAEIEFARELGKLPSLKPSAEIDLGNPRQGDRL